MDPIERLNLFITMWEQWINSNKNYKYHGVNMQCKSKLLYVPIYRGIISPKLPPVYYEYDYSGPKTFGWFRITFEYVLQYLIFLNPSSLLIRRVTGALRYDIVHITILNPKTSGSVSFSVVPWFSDCGFYDESIPSGNWCMYNCNVNSPLSNFTKTLSRRGWCAPPDYLDKWCWSLGPDQFSFSYSFNWFYNETSKKYDIWDSAGQVQNNSSLATFHIYLRFYNDYHLGSYAGSCFRNFGEQVTNIVAYSGHLIPHP